MLTQKPDQPAEQWSWVVHPARAQRGRLALALVIILSLAGLLGVAFQSLAWALFAVVVLTLSVNRFFLPSRFIIDERGITARYPLRRTHLDWCSVRRFAHDREGGVLSTRARSSWFDAFSSMQLMFDERREEIVQRIQTHIQRHRTARRSPSESKA